MIVGYLDIHSFAVCPIKADPILDIDPNTPLPFPIAFEFLEAALHPGSQVGGPRRFVEALQQFARFAMKACWQSSASDRGVDAFENVLRSEVAEAHMRLVP
jgi:hypothetical protein